MFDLGVKCFFEKQLWTQCCRRDLQSSNPPVDGSAVPTWSADQEVAKQLSCSDMLTKIKILLFSLSESISVMFSLFLISL